MGRGWWSGRKSRAEAEAELARLAINLNGLPTEVLQLLSAGKINKRFDTHLSHETILRCKKKILKAREEKAVAGKGIQQPNAETINAQVVLEQLAGVSSKTFANLGDAEKIGSEDALRLINKILKRYDASILDRNLKRRLPK
jgi:hypothetical protein